MTTGNPSIGDVGITELGKVLEISAIVVHPGPPFTHPQSAEPAAHVDHLAENDR